MKKKAYLILIGLLVLMFALSGCSPKKTSKPSIRLRSETQQQLIVGESMNIAYSLNNTESGVLFASSNDAVVTVDEYGSVFATGTGEADVTLTLKDVPTLQETVHFTVTKTFFMQDNDYKRGSVDIADEESGTVQILDGQAMILVNNPAQAWYFKCHLKNTGYSGSDDKGGWGVGSFLVNHSNPIGDVMFWYGLRREQPEKFSLYYGGWRYQTGITNKETGIGNYLLDLTAGVDVTIIRSGIRHYVTYEGGGQTVKFAYDVPLFEGMNTYPGIYGQNQKVTVTEYEASSDPSVVAAILGEFQYAESVNVNVIDNRLVNNQVYNLTSTVLPDITTNKQVKYELIKGLSGVTLSKDGQLSVGDVTGQITVKAISQSNPDVTDTQIFELITKPQSTSLVIDTGMIVRGTGGAVTVEETDGIRVDVSGGVNYVPLLEKGDKWRVDFTLAHTNIDKTSAGIMSAKAGFTHYVNLGLAYTIKQDRLAAYGELGTLQDSFAYAARLSSSKQNNITFIKDGADYFFMVNGKLNKHYRALFGGETSPVLYSENAKAVFSDIRVTRDATAIDTFLQNEKFYVGGYVQREAEVYKLAKERFGANDMDWPPVNDYTNGLKLKKSIRGAYNIEFTMSDIVPYDFNGEIDAKILVYLRSETKTSSLQFVIKKVAGKLAYTFTPNFDDAHWEAYALPTAVDFTKAVKVKIVKTLEKVELYLNDGRVYETEAFMLNNGYWGADTVCTPGIGSFRCGVTISNPVITQEV